MDPISVNPLFVQDGVKKITTLLSFRNVLYKTMQTFDSMLKKIHRYSVNRFDGDIFLVWFDYQNQSDDDTMEVWSDNPSQL